MFLFYVFFCNYSCNYIGFLIRKSTQQMCPMYNVLLCLSLDGDMQRVPCSHEKTTLTRNVHKSVDVKNTWRTQHLLKL